MKKRILSLTLVLIMILSMAQFTVSADTAATREYQIIDMTSVANGTTYVTPDLLDNPKAGQHSVSNWSSYPAPEFLGINYTSNPTPAILLNKLAWDGFKDETTGLIYAEDGTPFNFRTEADKKNTINLGGYGTGKKTNVKVPVSGNFTSVDFVPLSTGTASGNGTAAHNIYTSFRVKVNYADGTVVEDAKYQGGYFTGWVSSSYFTPNGVDFTTLDETYIAPTSQFKQFAKPNTKMRIQDGKTTDYWGTAVPTYSIATIPGKTVESIEFTHTDRAMIAILAMTGVKATANEVVESAMGSLPVANTITAANYANYVSTVALIDAKLAAGATLSKADLAKFNAVKDVVEYYQNRYQIIDMTAAANGTVYAVPVLDPALTGNAQLVNVIPNLGTDYHAPKYPNVQYSTAPASPAYLLNKTIMDSKKDASGYIYADDGVPFSFRTQMDTDDTINIGGIASGRIQKAELPVSGNFTSIDVVLTSTTKVNGSYGTGATAETVKTNTLKNDVDFKATVYYTDGTVVTDPNLHGMFLGWGDVGAGVKLNLENIDTASGYTQPKSQISAFTTALNQGLRIKPKSATQADWERYWCTQIPTYSIETIPTKTVEKVVFEQKERCVVSILAMTGVKASPAQAFEGLFENIPDASAITDANYKTYLSLYEDIEEGLLAGYAVPAGYADAYEAFAEEMEYYANKYTVIDFSKVADANGKMYGTPEEGGAFPSYATCASPEYISINYTNGGNPSIILNKPAFDAFKDAEGLIYADDGVPFLFRTENDKKNALNLGGYGTGKKTQIEVPVNGNFTSIDLVALSTGCVASYAGTSNGVIPAYNDDTQLVAEIHYVGGEVVVSDFHGKLLGWKDTSTAINLENVDTAAGFTQPKSQFSQFAKLNTDLRIKSTVSGYYNGGAGVEQYWGTAVPTYSIETDPAKTVEKIVFKHDLRCMVSILAMTGVNDPRNIVAEVEAAAPTIEFASGKQVDGRVSKGSMVTLATETEGATIYYTLDGSVPTVETGLVYDADAGIEILADGQIKAIAGGEGFTASAVTESDEYEVFLLGDVNGDGEVLPADRIVLARFLAEWDDIEIDEDAADLNGDEEILPADRIILARFLAEWDDYDQYIPYTSLEDEEE